MSRRHLLAAGALAALLVAVSASAHSLLLESAPAANATVTGPERITLRFNNRVEKRLCRVRLVDGAGKARLLDVRTADGGADELVAAVPSLSPGPYRVEWQVFSTDGHVVSGAFPFRIAG